MKPCEDSAIGTSPFASTRGLFSGRFGVTAPEEIAEGTAAAEDFFAGRLLFTDGFVSSEAGDLAWRSDIWLRESDERNLTQVCFPRLFRSPVNSLSAAQLARVVAAEIER